MGDGVDSFFAFWKPSFWNWGVISGKLRWQIDENALHYTVCSRVFDIAPSQERLDIVVKVTAVFVAPAVSPIIGYTNACTYVCSTMM